MQMGIEMMVYIHQCDSSPFFDLFFGLFLTFFLAPVPLQQCEGESLVSELVRLVDEKGLAFGLKVVGVVTLALVLREGVLLLSWWLRYCTERYITRSLSRIYRNNMLTFGSSM
ncbi:unnamed protein product [Penicillium roqueforti FM164]|uniref:Uncharacterized protein n=1 Tax=Penicillium roqueforti (strain FM164) TaxID=1365484 RepID=W6QJU7_PENRF|nr:unnamed protein product [Penicillium roqueforti FM164]